MDNVYLLNNPFTFQAMEKHAAYCAMLRLGLHVPTTWLIPHKLPPDNPRYVPMAERYNPPFDLEEVAEHVGYPLFMKPFDGGQWIGVTRITNADELRRSYDDFSRCAACGRVYWRGAHARRIDAFVARARR